MPGSRFIAIASILLLGLSAAAAGENLDRTNARAGNTPQGAVDPAVASRFLSQATFGATWEEIHRTADIGLGNWLDQQFQRPIGYHQPLLEEQSRMGVDIESDHRRWVWWQQIMQGPDPLRQRVAFALSEIFVVSDNVGALGDNPIGLANYYDMLLDNAFGNFRDLLHDVTMHPIMGVYLSHLKNEKSDPRRGRFPDENYAREVMQLFSVGLFDLRPDGTLRPNGAGNPIPTYDNDDITEFAKIFTGLSFSSPAPDFRSGAEVWTRPMRMYDEYHEPGPKYLLRGKYLPPGRTGMQDIHDAMDNLFEHPNVGPFMARRLIQRLVSSNPSPQYVERVATAFDNNGNGVRGDLKAVIMAVLLDPEAREWPTRAETRRGRLRESYLRRVHLARVFDAFNLVRTYPLEDRTAPVNFGQRPLSSPTVFNFFLPDHQPTGPIAEAGMFAPEFQIITAVTAISSANELQTQVDRVMNSESEDIYEVRLDLSDEIASAMNPHALVDRLDLLLTFGHMSAPMRQILIEALEQRSDPEERAKLALSLIAISPEYAVLK